jgi:SAM-dependent methyltransferase
MDYPGYDGTRLPFPDGSQNAVFASHCLEHIQDVRASLADWYRVLETGGYLLIFVPHKYLYERRPAPPSAMNPDHKRFYTPATLLADVEESLPVNGFRVRHLVDNDHDYDYAQSLDGYPEGCYEIELVIQKIARPAYSDGLEFSGAQRRAFASFERYLRDLILALHRSGTKSFDPLLPLPAFDYFTPFAALRATLETDESGSRRDVIEPGELVRVLRLLLPLVRFDTEWYLRCYPDVAAALASGAAHSAHQHFVDHGYFEGRIPSDYFRVTRGTGAPPAGWTHPSSESFLPTDEEKR